MSKQDRQGVRTASDLERKYNFASFVEAVKNYKQILERVSALEKNISSGNVNENALKEQYDAGYNAGYAEGQLAGYNSGKSEGNFLLERIYGYSELFNGAAFPDGYDLEFNLNSTHSNNISGIFSKTTGLKSIKLTGGNNNVCNCSNLFSSISTVETIDISELNIRLGNCTNIFLNDTSLKRIIGELDLTNCTNTLNFFLGCNVLEEVSVKAETIKISLSITSKKLSADTVQSIIDGLATVTESQTLTLPASIVLTDEKKATIAAKGWTLVQK